MLDIIGPTALISNSAKHRLTALQTSSSSGFLWYIDMMMNAVQGL